MFKGKYFEGHMTKYSEQGRKQAHESEMMALFSQLSKLVDRKAHLLWHIESFEQYIKDDINPFGLCIQIFPSFENTNDTFLKRWKNNLQRCSKVIMKLLTEKYLHCVSLFNNDINKIYEQLEPFKSLDGYTNQEETIETYLDQIVKKTLTMKEHKFWRDKTAFQVGKAYRWHNRKTRRCPMTN